MVNHCKADRFTTQDHSQHKEIKPLSLSPKSKRTTEVWIHFLWDFWLFRKTTQAYQLQCKSFLQATVFFCNWATSRGIIQGWHACFNDFCHEENPSPSFVDGMLVSRSQSPSDSKLDYLHKFCLSHFYSCVEYEHQMQPYRNSFSLTALTSRDLLSALEQDTEWHRTWWESEAIYSNEMQPTTQKLCKKSMILPVKVF